GRQPATADQAPHPLQRTVRQGAHAQALAAGQVDYQLCLGHQLRASPLSSESAFPTEGNGLIAEASEGPPHEDEVSAVWRESTLHVGLGRTRASSRSAGEDADLRSALRQ